MEDTVEYWKEASRTLQEELDEFVESSKELENALENELTQAEDKNARLEAAILQKETQLQELNKKSNESSQKLTSLESELNQLNKKFQQLTNEKRQLETTNDEQQGQVRILNSSLQDLNEQLDQALEQNVYIEGEKEALDERIHRLLEEKKELQADIDVQSRRVTSEQASRENDEISQQVVALEQQLAKRDEETKELLARQQLLTKERDQLLQNIKDMGQKLNDLQSEVELLRQQNLNQSLLDDLEELRDLSHSKDTQIQTLKDELCALENAKANLEKDIFVLKNAQQNKSVELEKQLETTSAMLQKVEKDNEQLTAAREQMEQKVDQLEKQLEKIQQVEKTQKKKIQDLSSVLGEEREKVHHLAQTKDNSLPDDVVRLRLAYSAQLKANASLLQRMQKLRGNVLVCCRIRPVLPDADNNEDGGKQAAVEALNSEEISFYNQKSASWRPFAFDRVFPPNATQTQVCTDISNLGIAESVVGGVNACIMAYGQTGSGKTHTMDGPTNDPGINYRTIRQVFQLVQLLEGTSQGKFTISLSMIEIYNEKVRDLLVVDPAESPDARSTSSWASASTGMTNTRRQDCSWVECESFEKAESTLAIGRASRSTAATNLNLHSSRSHLVICLQVKCVNEEDNLVTTTGQLFLVDLAGSERVSKSKVEGSRLDETKHINRSLAALGDVMEALDSKDRNRHIPYRNSKLTHILQPVLGGNARTVMILTVPPSLRQAHETLFSLQFAARARNIELGPAKRHVQMRNTMSDVNRLREINFQLQAEKTKANSALSEYKRKLQLAESTLGTVRMESSKKEDAQKKRSDQQERLREKELSELRAQVYSLRESLKDTNANLETEKRKRKSASKNSAHDLSMAQRKITELTSMTDLQRNELMKLRIESNSPKSPARRKVRNSPPPPTKQVRNSPPPPTKQPAAPPRLPTAATGGFTSKIPRPATGPPRPIAAPIKSRIKTPDASKR